jgi:hypothetical protein
MLRIGPVVLVSLALPFSTFASGIVFSTYAPGLTYGTVGYTVGSGWTSGNLFQPSLTGVLQEVDFAIGNETGDTVVNIQLLTNDNGNPGTLLESYTINATNKFSSAGAFEPALSVVHPILDAEKQYWLLVTSDAVSDNPWYFNSLGVQGSRYENGTITIDNMATFQVVDSQLLAPEPSTFALGFLALLMLFGSQSWLRPVVSRLTQR